MSDPFTIMALPATRPERGTTLRQRLDGTERWITGWQAIVLYGSRRAAYAMPVTTEDFERVAVATGDDYPFYATEQQALDAAAELAEVFRLTEAAAAKWED